MQVCVYSEFPEKTFLSWISRAFHTEPPQYSGSYSRQQCTVKSPKIILIYLEFCSALTPTPWNQTLVTSSLALPYLTIPPFISPPHRAPETLFFTLPHALPAFQ